MKMLENAGKHQMLENILKMLEIARKCLELQENVRKSDIILENARKC